MLLKVSSVFLVAVVGLWGRHVSGVATRPRGAALERTSASGGGGGRKVNGTFGLALGERTKMRAASCGGSDCPVWQKEGDHYRVPYELNGEAYTPQQAADFKWVVDYFGRFSNLKFVERGADEKDKHLAITNDYKLFEDDPCIGYPLSWRFQDVHAYLSGPCMTTGTIARVLMQAAGFHYEHTRPDRDDYVAVQNICGSTAVDDKKVESVGNSTPYDYASVLQLPASGWYSCSPDKASFVAKDSKFQPVLEADKMAPSTCDLAALASRFPGPVAPPKCVAHELPVVCVPVEDCGETCRDMCKMKCQHNLAPASGKPVCRLLTVDEIGLAPQSPAGLPSPPASVASASCPSRPVYLLVAALLGAAIGVAFPLATEHWAI